jgi:hypothetical protein
MTEYVRLIGTEQMYSAANRNVEASAMMQTAVDSLKWSVEQFQQTVEQFVSAVDRLQEIAKGLEESK